MCCPETDPWPGDAQVAQGDIPKLVATFNSGWKMSDACGGFYLTGRSAGQLRAGQRSLVIDDTGAATVGQWARDVSMNPHLVAVRQNLALIVDHGQPVDGLAANSGQRWGSYENQHQYTWRSGVGVDAAGDLIYVAGAKLTLPTLALALVDAGVLQAMELGHPLSFGLVRLMDAFGARPRCAYQAPTRDGTACRLVPVRRPARLLLPHPGMTLVPERPCVPAT